MPISLAAALFLTSLFPPDGLTRAPYNDAVLVSLFMREELTEISGLAISRRDPQRLWVINDGQHGSELHALGTGGEYLGAVALDGAGNLDWEDLASFEREGRSWLLVADVGDNGGMRSDLSLYVVEEPERIQGRASTAWTLRLRWPDGARDCEAVAVDPSAGKVYLLSKKRVPPELFEIELGREHGGTVQTARRIGTLDGLPQPGVAERMREPRLGRLRSQVSAMDLSADGQTLVVLTYRHAYLYQRTAGFDWAQTIAAPPMRVELPVLPQPEAIGFDQAGRSIYVSSERVPTPLIRLDPLR